MNNNCCQKVAKVDHFRHETYFYRELSFAKDDSIHVYRQLNLNWYEAEVEGRIGIVPVKYIELIQSDPNVYDFKREETTALTATNEGNAKALYTFDARKANQLPIKKVFLYDLFHDFTVNFTTILRGINF